VGCPPSWPGASPEPVRRREEQSIELKHKQTLAKARPRESRRVQARKDRDAGSTTHTPIPVTRGPNRMDRGIIREAAHRKPVRSSRAKGTPRGICTRSNAPGDKAESGLRPAFASCLARILSKILTKRSPGRPHRPGSPMPGEHETCSQARNSRQIKAVGIRFRVRTRARFNQSQPLATRSPLSSRSLRLSVHCVGICHPRRPGGPLKTDHTTQAPGGRKPKDHRFSFASGAG
jgi:hypothetical protein